MSGPTSSDLIVERRGAVAVLTLNRPERRNALSGGLVAALLDAVAEVTADSALRCGVITGQGTVFCAGGDLAGGLSDSEAGVLAAHQGRGHFAALLEALATARKPFIAAVNGDALGGGFGLAAATTLLVADEAARFGAPELRLGLFPWMIAPVLARNLPRKVLAEVILAGRRLSAEEGRAFGLVNRVATRGDALGEALRLAEAVAASSPAVMALGLEALAAVDDLPLRPALAHMHGQLGLNLQLEDAAEGISAFLSRRSPEWKGR